VAATWYSDTQFDITVALSDGQPRQVAFYCLDYESAGRSQRFDVFDANTNVLLDTRTINDMTNGVYVTWIFKGTVRVHLTRTGNKNAVVSGVFVANASTGDPPPTATITSPATGTSFASGTAVTIAADATDVGGSVSSVDFYADGQLIGTDTSSPYSVIWTNASVGSHTLTAVAKDNSQQTTTSAPVQITVTAPGGGATAGFVGFDTTAKGDWQTYGTTGYTIVSDNTLLPSFATITPTNHSSWTWATSTTDVRALLRASAQGRVAATWYSDTQFDITVTFSDGQAHQVAFYGFDYESAGRSQRFDLYDATTGALLDSRSVSDLTGGVYATWTISGSVRVHLTRTGSKNAVISGVFIK
jgi:hypothetical protein